MKTKKRIINMVTLAILTAFVVVLQLVGSSIKIGPYGFSLVGVPVVVGAVLLGPLGGAFLGFVFGLVVIFTPDAAYFLSINVFYTILLIFGRGIIAGMTCGWTYKLFKKKNKTVGCIASAIVYPIINTGLFALGLFTLFSGVVEEQSSAAGSTAFNYVFLIMIGFNFIVEFVINTVLSPVIARICIMGQDKLNNEE